MKKDYTDITIDEYVYALECIETIQVPLRDERPGEYVPSMDIDGALYLPIMEASVGSKVATIMAKLVMDASQYLFRAGRFKSPNLWDKLRLAAIAVKAILSIVHTFKKK